MSKSQHVSQLKVRADIHDMDKCIQRKLKHIQNELSSDNVKLIEDYLNAIKLDACGKVVQDKHLQCILKMTPGINLSHNCWSRTGISWSTV